LAAFAVAVVFLSAVPFLFQWGFGNKFELGLAVLGVTLAYAVAHCMYCVARLYLMCDKSVWLINLVVVLSIAVNVGLNLVLLPRFGIYGVAAAGCTSAFTLLMGILCMVRLRGMPLNLVTPGIALLPLSLLCGPVVAIVVLAAVMALAVLSPVLFDAQEKDEARQLADRLWRGGRIESLWQRMGTR
jgi:O-antigen/teichoic acid export membrane protein